MINPQRGFNSIIIRMLFAVTLFQEEESPPSKKTLAEIKDYVL
jgi:hypothetical protein